MAARHIAVETWLEALGLLDYVACFSKYNGVENMLYLSETEVNELGVRNAAHRAKIVSSLRILREKYERSTLPGKKNSPLQQVQRSQSVTAQLTGGSPPSLLNSPDYQQIDVSPERLQHDLLVELQGDPADLKSKAWYHGSISRQRAERLVAKNGDFLVRDCISQPGDFVLTCCWKKQSLHFVINSSVFDQGPYKLPKVTYHFEETHFNSVQELVQFYMDECKQITEITGAVITTPIARSMPLTYYDSKYGALSMLANSQGDHYSMVHNPNQPANPPQNLPIQRSPYGTPLSSPASGPANPPQTLSYQRSPHVTPGTSPHGTPRQSPQGTPGTSPGGSPKSDKRQRFAERSGSQPLLSVNDIPIYVPPGMGRSDSLPVITGLYNQVLPTQDGQLDIPGDDGIYKTVAPTPAAPQQTVNPVSSGYPPLPPHARGNQSGLLPNQSAYPAHFPAHQQSSQHAGPPVYLHQRSGSAPVLTPGVTVTQHFDYLAAPTVMNPAISDGDLSKAPPPKPSRIPSVKYKQKPLVLIRNKALYDDDSRDYSDYSQVTSEPSWLKPERDNQKENQVKSANQMQGDKMYDSNLKGVNLNSALQERDLNKNLAIKDENRKISETRFDVLDGHDNTAIPAFPLELDLKRGQNRNQDRRKDQTCSQTQTFQQTQKSHSKVKIPKIETSSQIFHGIRTCQYYYLMRTSC